MSVSVRPTPGVLEAIAGYASGVKMTEIPQWRCQLVRMCLENGEPDYRIVADGHRLVFDVSLDVLCTLTGRSSAGSSRL